MSISWLLVLLGLAVLAGAVWALFWAVDSGQFDDLEKHASDALEEEVTSSADSSPGPRRAS
jgi:cbb3-type cytochrome oxidase maturation protein